MSGVSLGQARCVRVTRDHKGQTKAIQVVLEPDAQKRWVPFSVVHDDSEVYAEGDRGNLVVQEWWAEKEGLS